MFFIVQKENPSATSTAASTSARFSAENRMMDLIMASLPVPGVRIRRARLRAALLRHRRQGGLEPRLAVDEEVRPGHHLIAFGEPREHLHELRGLRADGHLAGLEPPVAE